MKIKKQILSVLYSAKTYHESHGLLAMCKECVKQVYDRILPKKNVDQKHYFQLEYQQKKDYSAQKTDIKALAFYLPQFYEDEQNNQWWGQGFTEWTNTKKATPLFSNHYQPREPHDDIGYYKLDEVENIRKQAILAKQYGIYGFCIHHYWFNTARLLEKPLNIIMENLSIDIPFCLSWANHNWTKHWFGLKQEMLKEQNYDTGWESNWVDEMQQYVFDPRYIRIEDKPVLIIYDIVAIPDVEKAVENIRSRFLNVYGTEVYLIATDKSPKISLDKFSKVFDAFLQFPPLNLVRKNVKIKGSGHSFLFDYNWKSNNFSVAKSKFSFDYFPGVMMGWDNTARQGENSHIYVGFSDQKYKEWISYNMDYLRKNISSDRRFLFINAWNEWAEGTYLEPDKKYGYAYLDATAKAIFEK